MGGREQVGSWRDRSDEAYDGFLETRYWPALDGLRALSIVLVLIHHMHDTLWEPIDGSLGVTLFFVISGFLITTLLLREEAAYGQISLKRFYIRRVFRIVPLYAIALVLFSVLVLGFGQGQGSADFAERLPLLATFNGEFAGGGTFSHSWSLGIEEKFYILWPLLAFGIPWVRRCRGLVVSIAIPVAAAFSFLPTVGYFGIYLPIIGGCALAFAANGRRTFRLIYLLSRRLATYILFAILVSLLFLDRYMPLVETWHYAETFFSFAAMLSLPGVILSQSLIRKFFSLRAIVYYGTRAYAIYLFHPLCIEVVDRLAPPGTGAWPVELLRFGLVFALSLAVADLAYRTVELPMIKIGRRLTARPSAPQDSVSQTNQKTIQEDDLRRI